MKIMPGHQKNRSEAGFNLFCERDWNIFKPIEGGLEYFA